MRRFNDFGTWQRLNIALECSYKWWIVEAHGKFEAYIKIQGSLDTCSNTNRIDKSMGVGYAESFMARAGKNAEKCIVVLGRSVVYGGSARNWASIT